MPSPVDVHSRCRISFLCTCPTTSVPTTRPCCRAAILCQIFDKSSDCRVAVDHCREAVGDSPLVLTSVIPLLRPELWARPDRSRMPEDPPKEGRERALPACYSRSQGHSLFAVVTVANDIPSVYLCEGKEAIQDPDQDLAQSKVSCAKPLPNSAAKCTLYAFSLFPGPSSTRRRSKVRMSTNRPPNPSTGKPESWSGRGHCSIYSAF